MRHANRVANLFACCAVTTVARRRGLRPREWCNWFRVMLCVVHYAVRAWVVSITPLLSGRVGRAVGSDGVSMAMEVSER